MYILTKHLIGSVTWTNQPRLVLPIKVQNAWRASRFCIQFSDRPVRVGMTGRREDSCVKLPTSVVDRSMPSSPTGVLLIGNWRCPAGGETRPRPHGRPRKERNDGGGVPGRRRRHPIPSVDPNHGNRNQPLIPTPITAVRFIHGPMQTYSIIFLLIAWTRETDGRAGRRGSTSAAMVDAPGVAQSPNARRSNPSRSLFISTELSNRKMIAHVSHPRKVILTIA